jgi:hypothetical protein
MGGGDAIAYNRSPTSSNRRQILAADYHTALRLFDEADGKRAVDPLLVQEFEVRGSDRLPEDVPVHKIADVVEPMSVHDIDGLREVPELSGERR